MKSFNEKFARFFETPSREGLRDILIHNYGELNNLDFKRSWSNLPKMAKHLLAFANSGGGCIIIGVSQEDDGSLISSGIKKVLDKADFHKGIEGFVPKELEYDLLDFSYSDSEYSEIINKTFQVIVIEDTPQYLPFISKNNGDGINKNVIYIRNGTSSEETSYDDLQKIINRKIRTNYSTNSEMKLEEHLSQLKVLYSNIEKNKSYYKNSKLIDTFREVAMSVALGDVEVEPNPLYPEEDYEQFISRMIKLKMKRIEELLLLR